VRFHSEIRMTDAECESDTGAVRVGVVYRNATGYAVLGKKASRSGEYRSSVEDKWG
jgi:hypothetical protein